jgi:hypothetical protein
MILRLKKALNHLGLPIFLCAFMSLWYIQNRNDKANEMKRRERKKWVRTIKNTSGIFLTRK